MIHIYHYRDAKAPDLLASSGPPNVDIPTKENAAMWDAGLDLRCFCPGRPTAWTTTWRPPQWRQRTEMPTWNNVGRMWRWRRILTLGARCQHVLSTSFKFVNFKSVFSRSNILNWQVGIKWSCHFYLRVRGITCLTVELEPPRRSNGIAIPRALLVSCPTRPKHWSKSSILLKHSGFGSPLCYLVWLLMVRFLPSQPLHTVGSSQWQSKHTPVSELFEHPFVFSLPTFTFKWWRRWSLFLDMFRHFPNMSWWCHRSCHCTIGQIYEFYESFKAVSEATLLALSPIVMLPTQVHPGLPRCAMLFPLRLTTSSTPSASAWRRVLPSAWSSQVLIWALSRAKCMQKTCLTVSKIWRWAWSCAVSDLSSIRHCLRWLCALHSHSPLLAKGLPLDASQQKSCCTTWRKTSETLSTWAKICHGGSRPTSSPRTEARRVADKGTNPHECENDQTWPAALQIWAVTWQWWLMEEWFPMSHDVAESVCCPGSLTDCGTRHDTSWHVQSIPT